MFDRNENRNEGTFACSAGTLVRKTGGGGHVRQNHPFTKPPFGLLSTLELYWIDSCLQFDQFLSLAVVERVLIPSHTFVIVNASWAH